MFRILDGRTRRREWSPGTVLGSVLAHGLLFGGVALAAASAPEPEPPEPAPPILFPVDPPLPPPPPEPAPAPAAPVEPPADAPAAPPKPGDFVELRAPTTVPPEIPEIDLRARPIRPQDVRGIGVPGDVRGAPDPADPRPPTGADGPAPAGGTIVSGEALERRPALRNGREMERLLRREYPAVLRDAGIAGRTVVEFVIDVHGRVEPGSIRVVQSTRPEFAEASRRAAERMRFAPARVDGVPVRVLTALPIEWTVPG